MDKVESIQKAVLYYGSALVVGMVASVWMSPATRQAQPARYAFVQIDHGEQCVANVSTGTMEPGADGRPDCR